MATVWVKPHFLEKDGQLKRCFLERMSVGLSRYMFIRGGNKRLWGNDHRLDGEKALFA